MKNKFKGELKRIDPKFLVSNSKEDKVEDFFITLGLVFNDLKGFMLFIKLLEDNYEKPDNDAATVHAGNFGGILVQIDRFVISSIFEFFKFLEENKDLFSRSEFGEILDKLSKENKNLWQGLFAASRGDLSGLSDFFKTLLRVRNNIGYHYYEAGKNLRRGYRSFFSRNKNSRNEEAFYSIGENVEKTRFYFSDAAAAEFIQLAAGKKDSEEENELLKKFRTQLGYTINVLNLAIANILDKYIKSKRNCPH